MVSKRTRALVLLTVQNAGISLLTRHSRRGHHQDLYLPSVAVFSAEVRLAGSDWFTVMHADDPLVDHLFYRNTANLSIHPHSLYEKIVKALVSLLLLARDRYRVARSKKEDDGHVNWSEAVLTPLKTAISTRWSDLAVLLIPSILYAGQNNLLVSLWCPLQRVVWTHLTIVILSCRSLQYVAISNLPATVYQVTYQLKILTTAIFSVIFFHRRYSSLKWFSLLLLTLGVAIVQLPSDSQALKVTPSKYEGSQDKLLGFMAVFAACLSSAIAGCYFE